MNSDITAINQLLKEVVEQLSTDTKSGRTSAAEKLERIAAIASTLALTIRLSRH